MIPTYLNALAATVRDLVASGKAVHVTNEIAAELDLLAGLPWGEACWCENGSEDPLFCHECTLADLALGWLLASRAMPQTEWVDYKRDLGIERITDDRTKRAAQCAELAKEAAQMLVLKRAAQIVPMPWTAETINPDLAKLQAAATGTREGARAAWGFVVEQCDKVLTPMTEAARRAGKAGICSELAAVRDRYRRELEAM